MFIGREAELRFLEHYYVGVESQILVVYGQKGVGKTTLLKHFMRGKKCAYYHARACSSAEQRYQWANELINKGIAIKKYPEYEDILDLQQVRVLVIDEFHHIIKSDDEFMVKLLNYCKSQSEPVLVVLCTSASGWVENSMISKMGSMAAALSGWLKVREMQFKDMRELYPSYSYADSIKIYAALGGIPGLWSSFSEELSATDNIVKNIVNRESRLHEEMTVYMSEELREPAVYNTLLACMARGCNKLNDIYAHTGFSRAKISVYLKNLMELDLVEKVFSPETDGYANAMKGIYRISNPYVRFYFRFLFPNQSLLDEVSAEEFYSRIIADYYPDFVEEAYRKICVEQLASKYSVLGEWVGKTGNIDVVAKDHEENYIVAACSYARKMKYEDYEWLLFQLKQAKIVPTKILLFGEAGFDENLQKEALKGTVKLLRGEVLNG